MSGVGVGVGIGAGVGVSSVALAPFNAANTFMGSAFFGYGMILGERYAYQADWPKIQARLENGEKIENIIQEYTGRFTAVVMKEAKIIFESVTEEFINIMANAIKNALDPKFTLPVDPPTIGDPRRQPFIPPTTVPKPKPFDPNNPVIPPIQKPVPRVPTKRVPPPTKPIINIAFLEKEAQGKVIKTPPDNLVQIWSMVGGVWRKISRLANFPLAFKLAAQSWPNRGYTSFTFGSGNLVRRYYILKSKL